MSFVLRVRVPVLLSVIVAAMLLIPTQAFALGGATRTWVSGVGDDANPCSRTAPCKTFAGSISKTGDGGEINTLDPGGFGAVTITRSMTIDASNALGGVLNSSTNGIIINGEGIDVVLRNLDINGASSDPAPAPCPWRGVSGIRILNAHSVRIENTRINGQATAGVIIAPTVSANIAVSLDGVEIRNVCGSGIDGSSGATGKATVHIDDSSITSSGVGVRSGAGMKMSMAGTTLFGNTTALSTDGGTIAGLGTNTLVANGTPGAFTSDVSAVAPIINVTPPAPIVTPVPLVVALADPTVGGTSGKPVSLQYAATVAGTATLEVRRGKEIVASIEAKVKKGSNTITWNGKDGAKAAPAGTYSLQLQLDASGDRSASANATARMVRPARAKR